MKKFEAAKAARKVTMTRSVKLGGAVAVATALSLALSGCSTSDEPNGVEPPASTIVLGGAGATFPNPLWQTLVYDYTNNVDTSLKVNYQSIGSGGGITQFKEQTVHFGSSERYLSNEDLAQVEEARGCPAIQLPVVFGSVVVAFGDEEFDSLVLDAETIALIYDRQITNYNDPRIAALNPGWDLPDRPIIPVHRSDGSGTTNVFTLFLADEVPMWDTKYGAGTEVNWAEGTIGGQGNEGVAAGLMQPGGLGYINQAYALELGLPQAEVVNSDGRAIYPTLEATTAGLESIDVPESYQFSVLGIAGDGYPITGAVWNFFYTCGYSDREAQALKDFWTWALGPDGSQHAIDLHYAPLGEGLRARVLADLDLINSNN